jgi:flagellar hook capping protein FlgD/FG-GAP repeat protein
MKNLFAVALLLICFTSQAQWTQVGQDIDGEAAKNYSGSSVSLSSDGSVVAIGAPFNAGNGTNAGHVRVYQNSSGTWTQIGQDIDGEAAGDGSGYSMSLSSDGSVVAIGAPYNNGNGNGSGHVRVYENMSGTWTQIGQDIDGEAAFDFSGWRSVSLSSDGTVVAIGAPYNAGNGNGPYSGHVRVYKNMSGTWTQIGQDIDGETAYDVSGWSVSLSSDGTVVAIGAPNNNNVNGIGAGHVRVYENMSGTWTQLGQDIDGETAYDASGSSVSLSSDGTVVAIGAPNNDENGSWAGHVRVYQNSNGTWTQLGQDIDGEAAYNASGWSVSLSSDGSVVAIGAPDHIYTQSVNNTGSGYVRVYRNIRGTWTKIEQDINGEAADDQSGYSVSLSSNGTVVAIGAPYNDNVNGIDAGHVRVFTGSGTTGSCNKVQICHIPPGNPGNPQTICVSQNAVPAHLAHGDYLGACMGSNKTGMAEEHIENLQVSVLPNPFTDHATISVLLSSDANVEISIYSISGLKVNTLHSGNLSQGDHTFVWKGDDNTGSRVSKGMYILQINQGGIIKHHKLIKY